MSIKARLDDAKVLWANGNRQGALLMVLVAVAATSRKRYPWPCKDSNAFKTFLTDSMDKLFRPGVSAVRVEMEPGTYKTIQEILYDFLRCNLIHEADFHERVIFEPDADDSQVIGSRDGKVVLSYGWIDALARAVTEAEENADLFA